jgi:hypothetical protein
VSTAANHHKINHPILKPLSRERRLCPYFLLILIETTVGALNFEIPEEQPTAKEPSEV